jgi:transposase
LIAIITAEQLSKLDNEFLKNLSRECLLSITLRLLATVRTLYDRLNKCSSNSSLPPSSDKPWQKSNKETEIDEHKETCCENVPLKPKKKRSHGFGRSQKLPITTIINLYPERCDHCKSELPNDKCRAYTAYYQIDLEGIDSIGGYRPTNTKYILFECECSNCQGKNRHNIKPYKTSFDNINLSTWRLIGTTLASVLVFLNKEQGLSIRKIKSVLEELYGIKLSEGTITRSIHETGLAAEPIEEHLKEELLNSDLLHSDETSWKEKSKLLWLWVYITTNTCLFLLGGRTKKMAKEIISNKFHGWLMSDGYNAYRDHKKRFRCWAHLKRKAKGLAESNWIQAHFFGKELLKLFNTLMVGVYDSKARGHPESIMAQYKNELDELKEKCAVYKECGHEGTEKLAKEFLNDWDAIFRVLDYPFYPLTNNEAERALRHWVIVRKLTQGTRTAAGSRALTILASVIATYKLRGLKTLRELKVLLDAARSGEKVIMVNP